MKKRILVLLLALVMVAGFALPAVASEGEGVSDEPVVAADEAAPAATDEETPTPTETPAPTEEPTPTETPAPVEESAPASAEAEALLAAVSVSDGEAPATTLDPVQYVDENGNAQTVNDYTVVTSDMGELGEYGQETWYVVKGNVTISANGPQALLIQGNVNLILCDGAALTLQQNNDVFSLYIGDSAYSLTIYGQSGQTGTLKAVNSTSGCQAIGGGGSLTVNGGVLEANADGCCFVYSGTVTLHNGTIKAQCGAGSQVFNDGDFTPLTLPASYYWRTAASAKYKTQASYTADALGGTYFEVTTTKPDDDKLDRVGYLDWDSTNKRLNTTLSYREDATKVMATGVTTKLGEKDKETWYYVDENTTIPGGPRYNVVVYGTVHLILCDGATLTVQAGGICYGDDENDASLTIYAQSTGANAGKLVVDTARLLARAIKLHDLTVNGGSVEARGDYVGIALDSTASASLTINHGTVIATRIYDSSYGKAVETYENAPITLPGAYYWRTAADGKYKTQNVPYADSDLEGMYFELTTTKPASNIEPKVTGAAATVTYGDAVDDGVITATGTEVEGTFAWKDDVTGYGDVGTKTLMATFTPSDSSYAAVDVEVSVTVGPKTIGIDWTDTELTHNGKPQKPTATATGLVTGDECTITVTGEQTEAGRYTATAADLDNPNYKLPEEVTCEFTIKAAPTDDSQKEPPKTEKAPQTGDAGIALYVISALGSMSGLAWLGRKKKR